jgi:hypothetical protein
VAVQVEAQERAALVLLTKVEQVARAVDLAVLGVQVAAVQVQ